MASPDTISSKWLLVSIALLLTWRLKFWCPHNSMAPSKFGFSGLRTESMSRGSGTKLEGKRSWQSAKNNKNWRYMGASPVSCNMTAPNDQFTEWLNDRTTGQPTDQTNEERRHNEWRIKEYTNGCMKHTPSRKERKNNYFEQPAPTFIFWRFMPCFVWLMMSSCDIQFKTLAWDTLATPHFYKRWNALIVLGLSSKSAQLLAHRGVLQTPNCCTRCQHPQKHELVALAHASPATRSGKHCANDDQHDFMMPNMLAGGPHNNNCQAEKLRKTMQPRHFKWWNQVLCAKGVKKLKTNSLFSPCSTKSSSMICDLWSKQKPRCFLAYYVGTMSCIGTPSVCFSVWLMINANV